MHARPDSRVARGKDKTGVIKTMIDSDDAVVVHSDGCFQPVRRFCRLVAQELPSFPFRRTMITLERAASWAWEVGSNHLFNYARSREANNEPQSFIRNGQISQL